jgi:hypothetical protein
VSVLGERCLVKFNKIDRAMRTESKVYRVGIIFIPHCTFCFGMLIITAKEKPQHSNFI